MRDRKILWTLIFRDQMVGFRSYSEYFVVIRYYEIRNFDIIRFIHQKSPGSSVMTKDV